MSELYCTIAELKERLGLTGDGEDTLLTTLVTAASRFVDEKCYRKFYDEGAATRYFDGVDGDTLLIDDCQSITSLTTDSQQDGTYDGETWTEDEDFILLPYNETPKTAIYVLPYGDYNFQELKKYVKITGTWGWASVPARIKEATLHFATRMYHMQGMLDFQSERAGSWSYTRFSGELENMRDMYLIAPYRRLDRIVT